MPPGQSTLEKYSSTGDFDSDDEADIDDATRTLQIIDKLDPLVPLFFPTNDGDQELSFIFHDDLSGHNVLVNNAGKLTGILDSLPLWKACYFPSFLEGKTRHSEPDVGRYHHEDNGEPCDLYFEVLQEHEKTLLRDVFIDEMEQLDAGWMEVFKESQIKRDFDFAVHNCDDEFAARNIKAWIEDATAAVKTGDLWMTST